MVRLAALENSCGNPRTGRPDKLASLGSYYIFILILYCKLLIYVSVTSPHDTAITYKVESYLLYTLMCPNSL